MPGTVPIVTTDDMERGNMQDMRDLVRNEPGVSVGNQPVRGGFTNFVIRGIGCNRVVIMTDGVRVPDFPGSNAGSPTGCSRGTVDLQSIKQVEFVRGLAPALYGRGPVGLSGARWQEPLRQDPGLLQRGRHQLRRSIQRRLSHRQRRGPRRRHPSRRSACSPSCTISQWLRVMPTGSRSSRRAA